MAILVRQKSTGYFLTLRGGFRKGLTASHRVATFKNPNVAGLASTTRDAFPKLCRELRLDPEKVEAVHDNETF